MGTPPQINNQSQQENKIHFILKALHLEQTTLINNPQISHLPNELTPSSTLSNLKIYALSP